MNKKQFVEQLLEARGIPFTTGGRYNKDIVAIICDGYRGHISAGGFSKLTKKYFPEKPANISILRYLQLDSEYKWCPGCKEVKRKCEFSSNASKMDSLMDSCKSCMAIADKPHSVAKAAKYRAAKLQRTPEWADDQAIKEFYKNCPKGYQVDHIVPLQGELVSGLHTLSNLQYLSAEDNHKKGNKFKPT